MSGDSEALSAQLARTTMQALSSGLMLVDASGAILYLNPTGEDMLGVSLQDVFGSSYTRVLKVVGNRDLLEGESAGQPLARARLPVKVHGREVSLGITVSYVPKDAVHTDELPGDGWQLPLAAFLFRDLTEIDTLMQQSRQDERLAAIGSVATGVAHGLRNPLAGIRALAQVIAKELPEDSRHHADIVDIINEVDRADRHIRDLLNFAKPLSSQRSLIQLHELAQIVVDAQAPVFANHDVTVELDLQPTPDTLGHQSELELAIGDILQNALEAASGGGTIWVRTGVETARFGGQQAGERIFVEVSDSGGGIRRERLSDIFTPFYSTKSAGSGLGLANCQRIIYRHGGRITVSSAPRKGSTFRIRLPVETPEATGAA